jgi:hypothetical protein
MPASLKGNYWFIKERFGKKPDSNSRDGHCDILGILDQTGRIFPKAFRDTRQKW